jgi:hypothetical protein
LFFVFYLLLIHLLIASYSIIISLIPRAGLRNPARELRNPAKELRNPARELRNPA